MKLNHLPNILTILRLLLIAPLMWALVRQSYDLALAIFAFAGLTDALDGYLARRFSWTSRFGSIVDPLADKLLLTTSFVTLTWLGHIPVWLCVVVVARDVLIISGVAFFHYLLGRLEFSPSWISKINTFLQIVLVLAVLVSLSLHLLPLWFMEGLMLAVLFTTTGSMVNYTVQWGRRGIRVLKATD